MAKWSNDAGLDAALSWYSNSNIVHLCKSQPASYAALSTESLGSVAMVAGDFVLANGDASGRKVTVSPKDIAAATASDAGTALHVALANSTDSTLRYVTTAPSQSITAGNAIQLGSWKIEITDPV